METTASSAAHRDLRDWLDEIDPGTLDAGIVDASVDVIARRRKALVEAGAR